MSATAAKPIRVKTAEEYFNELTADPQFQAVRQLRQKDQDAEDFDRYKRAERQAAEEVRKAQRGTYKRLGKLLTERTTVEWLIRDFIEAGVIALFAGPKGSYKSALVNDIAMRVAVKGLPVFILSPEGSGLQRRLQGWLNEFAPKVNADTLPLYVRDRRLNLSAAEEMEALVGWLDEIEKDTGKPLAFVVIDTWSKATAHDEDNNTETKLLLGEIDKHLRHRGPKPATVAIVAHTGHSNEGRARGASALAADTDAEYIVSFKSDTVGVTRSRFKDSPALPPLYYKPKTLLLDYADGDGITQNSVVLLPSAAPSKLRQELSDAQGKLLEHATEVIGNAFGIATAAMILEGMSGDPKTLKKRLASLASRGLLMLAADQYSVPAPLVCSPEGF